MKKLLIILNALTITSSTVQLTACKIPTSNPEGIELNKITLDMFFDPQRVCAEISIMGNKIGTLKDSSIAHILYWELYYLFKLKITGIDEINNKGKERTEKESKNDSIWIKLTSISVQENGEIKQKKWPDIKVVPQGDKKFEITIVVEKWDNIKKDIEFSIANYKGNRNVKLEEVKAMHELVKGDKVVINVDFSSYI